MHRLHAALCSAGLSYIPIMGKDTLLVTVKKIAKKAVLLQQVSPLLLSKKGGRSHAPGCNHSTRFRASNTESCAHLRSAGTFRTQPYSSVQKSGLLHQITREGQDLSLSTSIAEKAALTTACTFSWVLRTPFGLPVVPLV